MFDYFNPFGQFGMPPIHSEYGLYPHLGNMPMHNIPQQTKIQDYGPNPITFNIKNITRRNNNYRANLWTGNHLQLTLMSINVNDSIGLEVHNNHDQFVRVEQGQGVVLMGDTRNNLDYERAVTADYAFIIPAGKWHNLINTGNVPLKLYTIYAPPEHAFGTIHKTKLDAEASN